MHPAYRWKQDTSPQRTSPIKGLYERELYAKAVEQLGHEKAPVRLGALYSLERLAEDKLERRQIIVDVICAYLRMPFSPSAPAIKPEPEATEAPKVPAAETERKTEGTGDTWQQERQVRLTAQRILAGHLRDGRTRGKRSTDPPGPLFWRDIRLNLAGATLIDFNLENGVLADANFAEATFIGDAGFGEATFTGNAGFGQATFTGNAGFSGAKFTGNAGFSGTKFTGGAGFERAIFSDTAGFTEAKFTGYAAFGGATFSGNAGFGEAKFTGGAGFGGATFTRYAGFSGAKFTGGAVFSRATFTGYANFDEATFSGGENGLSFYRSRVPSPLAGHVWPTGWRLESVDSGGYTVVRAEV